MNHIDYDRPYSGAFKPYFPSEHHVENRKRFKKTLWQKIKKLFKKKC